MCFSQIGFEDLKMKISISRILEYKCRGSIPKKNIDFYFILKFFIYYFLILDWKIKFCKNNLIFGYQLKIVKFHEKK